MLGKPLLLHYQLDKDKSVLVGSSVRMENSNLAIDLHDFIAQKSGLRVALMIYPLDSPTHLKTLHTAPVGNSSFSGPEGTLRRERNHCERLFAFPSSMCVYVTPT